MTVKNYRPTTNALYLPCRIFDRLTRKAKIWLRMHAPTNHVKDLSASKNKMINRLFVSFLFVLFCKYVTF